MDNAGAGGTPGRPMDRAAELRTDIQCRFTYHAPKNDQVERYNALREKAKELALLMADTAPYSRELSTALTLLEQSVMMANAAIARHE